jgi:glycosidase
MQLRSVIEIVLLSVVWRVSFLMIRIAGEAFPPLWRTHAIIYEIYPRSFQDSNGDGIGDLNGITRRLDYLRWLGIDAVWLTPIYPSPQVDFGYDISDYTAIDPQYGTLEGFDNLVREARRRNIRVLMDMVLNHTSDRHPWFIDFRGRRSAARPWWWHATSAHSRSRFRSRVTSTSRPSAGPPCVPCCAATAARVV